MNNEECLNEKCKLQAEYITLLEDYVEDIVNSYHDLMLKNAVLNRKLITQSIAVVDSQGNINNVQ
jgi:hypothetical protein